MTRARIAAVIGAVLAITLLVPGCGTSSAGTPATTQKSVVVFAASSLKESFTTIAQQYEAQHPGVTVKLNFAGSDTLASSINAGAPVDVFAAASPKTMTLVTGAKHAIGEPTTFARNQLEIVVAKGNPKHVTGLADTTKPGIKLVLCANSVPCGAAAQKAYGAARLQAIPASLELDVKAVLNKVQLGEADAGLVYVTDVKAAGDKVTGVPFPGSAKIISSYPIVGVSWGRNPEGGKAFIAYVLSKSGQDVLIGNGFLSP